MDIEKEYEVSLDIEPESVENLKNIVHSEIEEISKRFNNGTETLDDLINNYRHLTIKFEMKNGTEQDLNVVELKYYLKLIEKVKAMLNELDKKERILYETEEDVKALLRELALEKWTSYLIVKELKKQDDNLKASDFIKIRNKFREKAWEQGQNDRGIYGEGD